MAKVKKKYILYYDTEYGLGEKVDHIKYNTKPEAEAAIREYKCIDKICGNYNEYFIMEV